MRRVEGKRRRSRRPFVLAFLASFLLNYSTSTHPVSHELFFVGRKSSRLWNTNSERPANVERATRASLRRNFFVSLNIRFRLLRSPREPDSSKIVKTCCLSRVLQAAMAGVRRGEARGPRRVRRAGISIIDFTFSARRSACPWLRSNEWHVEVDALSRC